MKKKEPDRKPIVLNHIRIEAKDLVRIVKSVANDRVSVTAENGEWQFESMADLESNLPALKGKPDISIGRVSLKMKLSSGVTPPMIYVWDEGLKPDEISTNEYERIGENLAIQLRSYGVFFANSVTRVIVWQVFALLATLAALLFFNPVGLEKTLSVAFLTYLLAFNIPNFLTKLAVGDDIVTYSERDGFLKRNADKIATSVITTIIIAILLGVYSEFQERFQIEDDKNETTSEGAKNP